MDLDEYRQLKEEIEQLRRRADRAAGAKENILTQLHKEFNCNSVEQAEEMLVKEQRELEKKEKKLEKMMQEYREKWQELIDGSP